MLTLPQRTSSFSKQCTESRWGRWPLSYVLLTNPESILVTLLRLTQDPKRSLEFYTGVLGMRYAPSTVCASRCMLS